MPDREHTSKHYEQQLRELKNKLLLMSHKAEEMISDSIRSLVERRPTLAEVEAVYIRETLAATRGNKAEAARILGISRKNLYERLARESKDEGGGIRDE